MMREPYEDTMKRLSEDEKHSTYWSHSAARHTQELERSEERTQQEELAGSMRAEAINSAPIDELKAEIEEESFEEVLNSDLREDLYSATQSIDDLITAYIEDETKISIPRLLDIRADIESALQIHEQLN
jgi:hypothetical protein